LTRPIKNLFRNNQIANDMTVQEAHQREHLLERTPLDIADEGSDNARGKNG
jgi:hypothetical protein